MTNQMLQNPYITEAQRDGWEPAFDGKPVLYCDKCRSPICEGDVYYNIVGLDLCERCVEDCKLYGEGGSW